MLHNRRIAQPNHVAILLAWFIRHLLPKLHPDKEKAGAPSMAVDCTLFYDNPRYIAYLNEKLSLLPPEDILKWAIISVPHLYQTTAFGLTGLAMIHMISEISKQWKNEHVVPVIFVDTLHHFPETLALAEQVSTRYGIRLKTFKPQHCHSVQDFENIHGKNLWETSPDMYDFAVKVEPAHRAYEQLHVEAVLTGRRRSQKGDRSDIPILQVDTSGPQPLLKINAMAYWSFEQVWKYIKENQVPYNDLVNRGYRSIGDWHSTQPTSQGQEEREGRWAGQAKTECGLHKDYFIMRAHYLAAQKEQQQMETVKLE